MSLLGFLPINAANTLIMFHRDQVSFLLSDLQDQISVSLH